MASLTVVPVLLHSALDLRLFSVQHLPHKLKLLANVFECALVRVSLFVEMPLTLLNLLGKSTLHLLKLPHLYHHIRKILILEIFQRTSLP